MSLNRYILATSLVLVEERFTSAGGKPIVGVHETFTLVKAQPAKCSVNISYG